MHTKIIATECVQGQAELVKTVCRSEWDLSTVSAGVSGTGKECMQVWAGLGRAGGAGQRCAETSQEYV